MDNDTGSLILYIYIYVYIHTPVVHNVHHILAHTKHLIFSKNWMNYNDMVKMLLIILYDLLMFKHLKIQETFKCLFNSTTDGLFNHTSVIQNNLNNEKIFTH